MTHVMRRMLPLVLVLAATLAPAFADARSNALKLNVKPEWFGSTRQLFVDVSWQPKSLETVVTLNVKVDGSSLRTLRGKRWVVGRKLFALDLPSSVRPGAEATVTVRVRSSAGTATQAVDLKLR